MNKKVVSLLAILICLSLLVVACGGNGTTSTTAGSDGGDTTTTTAADEDGDDNGDDSIVAEPGTIPVLNEPMTMTIGISEDSNVLDYLDNYMYEWINERTNVELDIKFYPNQSGEARQLIELEVNSNSEMPEIILGILNEAGRDNYGAAGVLHDLSDLFESNGKFFFDAAEEAGLDAYDDILRFVTSPDGGIYAMPSWGASLPNQFSVRTWINTEFLETLDMDKPTTTEELVNFLTAVRDNDVNGNGIVDDEIGILGSTNAWNGKPLTWLLNSFIYMDNTDDRFIVRDGQLDVAYNKDEFREGLQFARMLADEGLLSSNSFTQDNQQYLAAINAPDPIVAIGVSGGTGGFNERLEIYDAMPAIEGPNGVTNATWSPPLPQNTAYITKDAQNLEAAFAFLSVGYSDPEYAVIKRFGEPGVDFRYADEGETSLFEEIGYPATIESINLVWGVPHQKHWMATNLPHIERENIEAGLIIDEDDPNNAGTLRNARAVNYLMAHRPDEVVYKIVYTAEESEATSEQRAAIRSYVNESMAQFTVGGLDPNNNSHWDEFISELERLGYEDVLEIDRQAYNRTMGQ